MDLTTVEVLVVVGLTGWLLYERSKRSSAEALNDNIETKEKVDAIQKDVSKNEARIEVEKEKQEALKENLEKEKAKDVSTDDLLDFFNKSDK